MFLTDQLIKEKIDKLMFFIQSNNITIQTALCLGLDTFVFTVCQQICQIKQIKSVALDSNNKNEIKSYIKTHDIDTIFTQKKDLRLVNDLLWEHCSLNQYICVDSDDIAQESDGKSKLMNKKLWDYTANNASDDIEGGGWINSFTREKFTPQEMAEYVQNVSIKMAPYLDKTKKVLEIGCSSGLTMYAIAPSVEKYVALDMSSCMIRKNNDKITREALSNIKLYCLFAHELNNVKEGNFNIGIINSVIHCFEGHFYFKRIIRLLIDKMSVNGIIFLGDILDADKKSAFEQSLNDYKEKHQTNTKVDLSQELFLAKGFFEDLYFDFPEISQIEISDKQFSIENELTEYRYDVIIKLNKGTPNNISRRKHKYQYSCDILQGAI